MYSPMEGAHNTGGVEHFAIVDDGKLTAVIRNMSSGKVCMKFMTLSLTGNLSTPPSCSGWKREREREAFKVSTFFMLALLFIDTC